jgi:hypothetical protein
MMLSVEEISEIAQQDYEIWKARMGLLELPPDTDELTLTVEVKTDPETGLPIFSIS